MMIHDITAEAGKHKRRKRVGRGPGSGKGKTCGRGHKGAGSRSGFRRRPGYEGGQMPFFMRIPLRGFNNSQFRVEYHVVNLRLLEERFDANAEVTPQTMVKAGLLSDTGTPIKVLSEGELTKPLKITVAACSAKAKEKIEQAGGSIQTVGLGYVPTGKRGKSIVRTDRAQAAGAEGAGQG
jgi:large subunit ribosomal protein L15